MSIFDRLKNVAEKTAKDAARSVGNTIGTKRETFTFSALPESLAEMQGFVILYLLSFAVVVFGCRRIVCRKHQTYSNQ